MSNCQCNEQSSVSIIVAFRLHRDANSDMFYQPKSSGVIKQARSDLRHIDRKESDGR